jgi:hypothetical protein
MVGRNGNVSTTPVKRTARFPKGKRRAARVEALTSGGSAPPMFAPRTKASAPVGPTTWPAAKVPTNSTMAMLE